MIVCLVVVIAVAVVAVDVSKGWKPLVVVMVLRGNLLIFASQMVQYFHELFLMVIILTLNGKRPEEYVSFCIDKEVR